MIEGEATTRKWGNSLGITLPKGLIEEGNIKENEKIKFIILKQTQTGERLFGMMKGKIKQSSQEIKDMLRRELHHG